MNQRLTDPSTTRIDTQLIDERSEPLTAVLFILTSVSAFVTILVCWIVAYQNNLPAGMWCPPISLTGFLWPERAVYVAGFTLTFVIGVSALRELRILFKTENPESKTLMVASSSLYVSQIGMLGQAWIPFQSDTFTAPFPRDLQTTTMVHLLFAAVFFYGSQLHGIAVLFDRYRSGNRLRLPVKLKTTLLLGNMFCLYCLPSLLPESVNSEGISQRLGVCCLLGLFADYSRDITKIRS